MPVAAPPLPTPTLPGEGVARLAQLLEAVEQSGDLDAAQYRALVQRLAGQSGAGLFAQRLHGATGGNPLFVMETLRHLFERQLLTIDPHSPPEFRANGAAVNHDGFHEAFKTKPGDKMFKPSEDRIRIW